MHLHITRHNLYCESLFTFQFQLYRSSEEWHEQRDKVASFLIGGPRHWLSWPQLLRVREDFGTQTAPRNRRAHNHVMLVNAASKHIPQYSSLYRSLHNTTPGDDATMLSLLHPYQPMAATVQEAVSTCPPHQQGAGKLSQRLYRALEPLYRPEINLTKPKTFLRERAQIGRNPVAPLQRIRRLLKASTKLPQRHAWNYLRLIHNGWHTHRRYQRPRPCVFCCGAEDSIEHYLRCPILRAKYPALLPSQCMTSTAFMLDHPTESVFRIRLQLLYEIAMAGNFSRRTGTPFPSP